MYRVNDEEILPAPEIDTDPLGIDDIDITRERSGR